MWRRFSIARLGAGAECLCDVTPTLRWDNEDNRATAPLASDVRHPNHIDPHRTRLSRCGRFSLEVSMSLPALSAR